MKGSFTRNRILSLLFAKKDVPGFSDVFFSPFSEINVSDADVTDGLFLGKVTLTSLLKDTTQRSSVLCWIGEPSNCRASTSISSPVASSVIVHESRLPVHMSIRFDHTLTEDEKISSGLYVGATVGDRVVTSAARAVCNCSRRCDASTTTNSRGHNWAATVRLFVSCSSRILWVRDTAPERVVQELLLFRRTPPRRDPNDLRTK